MTVYLALTLAVINRLRHADVQILLLHGELGNSHMLANKRQGLSNRLLDRDIVVSHLTNMEVGNAEKCREHFLA